MKGGVENGYLRYIGQRVNDSADPHQVGRIVERGEGNAILDDFEDFLVNQDGFRKFFPSVDYPVSHGRQLVEAFEGAMTWV